MIMTIFAAVLAVLIGFFTPSIDHLDPHTILTLVLVMSAVVFLGALFLHTTVLSTLENVEQKLVPNLMQLVRHDHLLHLGWLILFLFVLTSVAYVAFFPLIQNLPHSGWFFLGWLVFLGIALDVFRDSWNRYMNFLNPSYLVHRLSESAIQAVQNNKNDILKNNVDNLSEVALRAVEKSRIALSSQALQTFPSIVHSFLGASKSISHTDHDLNHPQGNSDESSFMIFYLLQRLELINDRALRDRLETICREMILILGKIIVYCAQFDLSMVSFPTHFLTKFGLKAQQHHFDEVAVLTTSTLLEIAKTIVNDIDITYAELQEPFRAIINGLDAIAKGTFKRRKDTSIKLLIQPLLDLKALFQSEKMAHHRDTPAILQEINQVLEEYTVLEQVMQTIPTLPNLEASEETPETATS